jgi:hypothetical protein
MMVRVGVCLAALVLAACPDDPVPIVVSDAGTTVSVDGGVDGGVGGGVDGGVTAPSYQRVMGATGGGAEFESPNYKLQINVGVPSPIGQGSGAEKSIKLGTGAAR